MSNRTIADGLRWVTSQLQVAGVEEAERESLLLVAAALEVDRAFLMAHPEHPVGEAEWRRVTRWTKRRAKREPLAYILKRRWFYGLEFRVTPDVLIPRPETETLVELFLEWHFTHTGQERPVLVDAGTGSGCIAIACLKHAPNWWGIGIDRSFSALRVAWHNRRVHRMQDRLALLCADWLGCLRAQSVHAVLSNPPYVAKSDLNALPPEIRDWESEQSLVYGAGTGLEVYHLLLPEARQVLKPGGLFAVEVGHGQAEAVAQLFCQYGWQVAHTKPDLGGVPRVVWSIKDEKDEWLDG